MKGARAKRGFTIAELVIVIAVIAILATVLIPAFSGIIDSAYRSKALQQSRSALEEYNFSVAEHGEMVPSGKVFVTDGYAFVFLNDSLHFIDKMNKLETRISSTGTASEGDLEIGGLSELTESSGSGTVYLTVTDEFGVKTVTEASDLVAETPNDSDPNGKLYKQSETIYFYQTDIDGIKYLGFFTLEDLPKGTTEALYLIQETQYSRLEGYSVLPEESADTEPNAGIKVSTQSPNGE